MQTMLIRRYLDTDRDAVWNLHNLALSQAGAHAGNGSWDEDLHHIPDVYLSAGGDFLVGLLGDRVVAMGALKRTSETHAEIKRMRVHPEHQRQGFGRQILGALEARATELGYVHLHLSTTARQVAAQALYRKHGYSEVDRKPWREFEVIFYEKRIRDDGVASGGSQVCR